mmetsp:Transcript_34312/g.54993  ORF Transcript_34312/g.54993 Transcript_34312/m.54993 type:complete len:213 (-) Transcript_34312:205-843(-)
MTSLFSVVYASCPSFSLRMVSRNWRTASLAAFSRAMVSFMFLSRASSSRTMLVSDGYAAPSRSFSTCDSSTCRCPRSTCTLAMLSATSGLSRRLRQSCVVVARSSSATRCSSSWFSLYLVLLGIALSTPRTEMRDSKRRSSPCCFSITREISSPTLRDSSAACTEASTLSRLSKLSFSNSRPSTTPAAAASLGSSAAGAACAYEPSPPSPSP